MSGLVQGECALVSPARDSGGPAPYPGCVLSGLCLLPPHWRGWPGSAQKAPLSAPALQPVWGNRKLGSAPPPSVCLRYCWLWFMLVPLFSVASWPGALLLQCLCSDKTETCPLGSPLKSQKVGKTFPLFSSLRRNLEFVVSSAWWHVMPGQGFWWACVTHFHNQLPVGWLGTGAPLGAASWVSSGFLTKAIGPHILV